MLRYENVDFKIKDKHILKNINLHIKENKITAIMGPNGSGKSSLINLLISNNHTGKITYQNKVFDIKKFKEDVAILFQINKMPQMMSVEDYVGFGLIASKGLFFKKDQHYYKELNWALNFCNVYNLKDELVSNLSGGQRQRVYIAYTIIRRPKLLILDEPTTYLDPKHQYEILHLLKILNKKENITILIILHDMQQIYDFSNEVIFLKKGEVLNTGTTKDIMTQQSLTNLFDIPIKISDGNINVNMK